MMDVVFDCYSIEYLDCQINCSVKILPWLNTTHHSSHSSVLRDHKQSACHLQTMTPPQRINSGRMHHRKVKNIDSSNFPHDCDLVM